MNNAVAENQMLDALFQRICQDEEWQTGLSAEQIETAKTWAHEILTSAHRAGNNPQREAGAVLAALKMYRQELMEGHHGKSV